MSDSPSQAASAAASGELPCYRPAPTKAAGANADKPDAVFAPAKSGVAIATAESEPAGEGIASPAATARTGTATAAERTESPAATARTSTATAAGNIIPLVVSKAASPATAPPAGVVAEPASDSHTHAASATAAEPAGVVTPMKCAELTATEGRASHHAVGALPEVADNTAAGSPNEASPIPLLPLGTSPPASNAPLACALLPSPSAAGLSDSNQGSQKKNSTRVAVASIADSSLSAFIHALCKADPHWWPGILHPFTTSMAEPPAAALAELPAAALDPALAEPVAALAEPAAAALAEPPAAAMVEPAAAALAEPAAAGLAKPAAALADPAAALADPAAAAAALAGPCTALAVTQPLTDAAMTNPHAASLAEAPSDARAPPLLIVSKSPAAAVVAAPSAISVAEPAPNVVAAPSAISLAEPAAPSAISMAEPQDASRAAGTLSALLTKPPELVPATTLAEPTVAAVAEPAAAAVAEPATTAVAEPAAANLAESIAAAVAEPAAAVPVTCGAAGEMPAATLTESPNTDTRGYTTVSQPVELPPSKEAATATPEATSEAVLGDSVSRSQSPPAPIKEATTAAAAAAKGIYSESVAVCSQQNKKLDTEAATSASVAGAAEAVVAPSKDVRVAEPAGLPASSSSTPQQSCGSYHSGTETLGPACVTFNQEATTRGES